MMWLVYLHSKILMIQAQQILHPLVDHYLHYMNSNIPKSSIQPGNSSCGCFHLNLFHINRTLLLEENLARSGANARYDVVTMGVVLPAPQLSQ